MEKGTSQHLPNLQTQLPISISNEVLLKKKKKVKKERNQIVCVKVATLEFGTSV